MEFAETALKKSFTLMTPTLKGSSGVSFVEKLKINQHTLKWTALSLPVAVFAGTASAGFLFALEWVTDWREAHLWVIALLPLCRFAVGWIYHHFGKDVEAGNTLLMDEIHDPRKVVPLRMAPLVLIATVLTHLFGGSAGREGTAVQMGGSLADQLTHLFKFNREDRRILIMAGISAGFGSVFGTPLSGAIFGLEVLVIAEHRFRALVPCLVSALLANQVTLALGIHHTRYVISDIPALDFRTLAGILGAGVAFGLTGRSFAKATHMISAFFKTRVSYAPFRPVIGGVIVAGPFGLLEQPAISGSACRPWWMLFPSPSCPGTSPSNSLSPRSLSVPASREAR